MSSRVLITGGVGYIGGRLCGHLETAQGSELRVTSHRPPEALPGWADGIRVWEIDFANLSADALDQLVSGVETIVHLAALNARECALDPGKAIAVNIAATQALIAAAERAGVKKFVYVSTAHVYGAPLAGHFDENSLPRPRHPYAWTHRAAEDIAMAANGMDITVFRFSNVIGAPRDRFANCWMLAGPDFCRQAVTAGEIVLRGGGQEQRDFLPMADAVSAIERRIAEPLRIGRTELFNLSSGRSETALDFACRVAARAEALFGSAISVIRGHSIASPPRGLHLDNQRYSRTGFVFQNDIDNEIDQMLIYCREQVDSGHG